MKKNNELFDCLSEISDPIIEDIKKISPDEEILTEHDDNDNNDIYENKNIKKDLENAVLTGKKLKLDLENTKAELEKASALADEQENKFLRLTAEYENYRRRTAKESAESESRIIAKTIETLLPVLDNLERALAAPTEDKNYKTGVAMTADGFISSLAALNVEELPVDEFDPNFHQAVQQIDTDDETLSGKIAQVFQKGYKIGDKVLRFAMVSVYK